MRFKSGLWVNFQRKTFRRLMWDYNSSPEEAYELLMTGEKERLGHYTRESLFTKLVVRSIPVPAALNVRGPLRIN